MENNEPLLSICIPTYNRADVLVQCLESIVTNDGFGDDVEVVVSNNCSTDDTEEICLKYSSLYPNIKYFKNDTNIGADRNILHVLELGTGTFLKLSNDYCRFHPKSIEFFKEVIKKNFENKPAIFFHHNSDGKGRNYSTSSLDIFLSQEAVSLSWISNHGFWKEDFQNFKEKDLYIETMFQQMDWTIRTLKKKKQLLCYINPIEIQDNEKKNKGGYNIVKVWTTQFLKQPNDLYKNGEISEKTLNSIKKGAMYVATWWLFRLTISDRKKFSFSTENGWEDIKYHFGKYPWYYVVFAKAIFFSALSIPYRIARETCKKSFGIKITRILFRDSL